MKRMVVWRHLGRQSGVEGSSKNNILGQRRRFYEQRTVSTWNARHGAHSTSLKNDITRTVTTRLPFSPSILFDSSTYTLVIGGLPTFYNTSGNNFHGSCASALEFTCPAL